MGNRQIRKTGGQRTQLPIMSLVTGEKSNFQYILRLLNTNVEGKQKVMYALTKIKGVGRRYSNLVCKKADVDLTKRAGELTSEELERIVTIIQNPTQYKISSWSPSLLGSPCPWTTLKDYWSSWPDCWCLQEEGWLSVWFHGINWLDGVWLFGFTRCIWLSCISA